MVSLTTRLFSSLDQKDGTLEIADSEQLRVFANGRKINIEGHDTKCFEDDLYDLVLQKMDNIGVGGESYKRLFTAMLFDTKAISTSEVANVFGAEKWRMLEKIWMQFLNQALTELGYSPGLLAFWLVRREIQQEMIFDSLKNNFSGSIEKGYLRFGTRLLSRNDIEDCLVDWTFNTQGELIQRMLLPANIETVQHLFGPLLSNDAEQLLSLFKSFADEKTVLHRLPKDLISQLFPPPCPPGLEFIRDPSERFNLWRRATVEYGERLEQDLPHAFVMLGRRSSGKLWSFASERPIDIGHRILGVTLLYEREHPRRSVSFRAWLLARARLTQEDLSSCEELLKIASSFPRMVIFLSNDLVAHSITEKMSPRLRRRACFLSIHPTYTKQMLATFWHINSAGAVYENVLEQMWETLLERDIGVYSAFDRWLLDGRASGFVVDSPALSQGVHRGLVNALRLLLNTQGTNKNLNEIFEWNRNVFRKLIPYGSRTGLIPETDRLESFEGFRALVGDLQTNGFVTIDSENRPTLMLSPCEKIILEELSYGEIHGTNWSNHLLVLAEPETIVEEVYVEALIQRGCVVRRKGKGRGAIRYLRSIGSSGDICKEAIQQAESFKQQITAHTNRFSSPQAVEHLVVVKERDVQVIMLTDIHAIIEERLTPLHSRINTSDGFDLKACANAVFLIRFIEDFGHSFLHKTERASQRLQTLSQSLSSKYNEYLSQRVPSLLLDLQRFISVDVTPSLLQELIDLKGHLEEVDQIPSGATEENREHIKKQVQQLSEEVQKKYFWFNSIDSDDVPHNYYTYRMVVSAESFQEKIAVLDRLLVIISDKTRRIKERREILYRQLTSLRVDPSARTSCLIFEKLKSLVQPQPLQIQSTPLSFNVRVRSVADLNRILDHRLPDLDTSVATIERAYNTWEHVYAQEKEFLSALKCTLEYFQRAKAKFNLLEHEESLNGIEEFIKEAQQEYQGVSDISDISPQTLEATRAKLSSLKEHVEETDKLIVSELWNSFFEKRRVYLIRFGKRVDVCKVLGSLSAEVLERYKAIAKVCEEESELHKFLDGPRSCTEEFVEFEQINTQVGEVLNRNLDETERIVLGSIIELGSSQGVDLDSLKNRIPSLVDDDIIATVKSLWRKGILSVKVFL